MALFFSVNWHAWWIATPLVLAETYSLIDVLFFGLTVWPSQRFEPSPASPLAGLSVDVFITTYNEPIELVMRSANAALAISYPHSTWILDDGARNQMPVAAEKMEVGYISRGEHWKNQPLHAKAGNLNNALVETSGEFVLILDADQIPHPEILNHTLGYFMDPKIALVQTPQWFGNVSAYDPLGSQAPLFYSPIQQGKNGWNPAFFCGSNAILEVSTGTDEDWDSLSDIGPMIRSLGWKGVYHHETLANGLAPQDLGSMLYQRLRWAQGTMQVTAFRF